MNNLRAWLTCLIAAVAAILVSWGWLDRPIALWVHAHQFLDRSGGVLNPLSQIPDPLIPAGAVLFVALGIWALSGQAVGRIHAVAVVCCFSVVVGETIKNGLKWLFGRPWPESWHGNPSFIRDYDYAFHWFHGGRGYEAFPSGHMAAAAAVLSVLWIVYPRWRPAYAVAGCLVAAALIMSNFHFLSDVIAGALLGASIGSMTTVLFDKAPHLLVRVDQP